MEIPMPAGGVAEAWVTRPNDDAPRPGVLFFMDAFGLRPRIAEMAQRIADWGYVVMAPNAFHRNGSVAELAPTEDLTQPGVREAFFKGVRPRLGALTVEALESDLPAYLAALRAVPGVDGRAVGVTGYCMGARLAVRAACLDPDVVAVGGFHGGGLASEADDSPHRGLRQARAEFVLGHADGDRSMDPEAVARLGAALAEAGLTARNEVYSGAAHGYTMSDTSVFDEAATERHFAELRDLLNRTLRLA
ncbi:dienelactone hydrolase [Knoellia subterranea KCTC 19937]|uniref:Dienelactone hydrolase n=1 Tax=Knoellia subterranea KCTC 19937 TaxID=1385521 RepID=A0A0A0JJG7_9MICO|nr:dienelactone hydrolase [Knoellia subterranea KCTC 19937]